VGALFWTVVLLSFFNAILRPVLILFMFVGHLVDGFSVSGFWPAVGGSLVLSITNFVMNGLMRPPGPRSPGPPPSSPGPGGDVIDI
jgi:putative membrane protein